MGGEDQRPQMGWPRRYHGPAGHVEPWLRGPRGIGNLPVTEEVDVTIEPTVHRVDREQTMITEDPLDLWVRVTREKQERIRELATRYRTEVDDKTPFAQLFLLIADALAPPVEEEPKTKTFVVRVKGAGAVGAASLVNRLTSRYDIPFERDRIEVEEVPMRSVPITRPDGT